MKQHRNTLIGLVIALGVALPAPARELIDVEREVDPRVEVSLELIAGTVKVIAWDRDVIHLTGSIDPETEELDVSGGGDSISIELEIRDNGKRRRRNTEGAELEIHLPRLARFEMDAISVDVTVEGLEDEVSVETVSGRIEFEGGATELDLSCISGTIRVESTAALRSGQFETVSGNVDFSGALHPKGRYDFETINGTITLRLPSDASVEIHAETFNGEIDNELGPAARRSSDMLPSQELRFSLGDGDARINAEAFNGRVRILRP